MKKLFAVMLALLFSVSAYAQTIIIAKKKTASNLIFYSDFEDATDDAQWGTLPAGWDDDYTTGPLAGSESLYNAASDTEHISDSFGDQSGTIYARFMFRATDLTNQVDNNIGLTIRLKADDTIAGCYLYWGTDDFTQLKAMDGSTTSTVNLTGTSTFDGATYYMYITYIPGTSVQCETKDTSGNVVFSGDTTLSTSQAANINNVSLATRPSLIRYRMDNVEIRKDTEWGSP